MFSKKTIRDISVKGKIVLVRVDYNVPIEDGKVTNDFRLKASLPTLDYLREHGAKKIILISHLGRPDGKRTPEFSLAPVAERLEKLLTRAARKKNPTADQLDTPTVHFVSDVSGPDVEDVAKSLKNGDILMLENLRFFPGEEKNSEDFISEIIESVHAQIFVQDGFAVIHRAHASTDAVTKELPSVAGLLLEKEVTTLSSALENPKHPVALIIGGSKVDDKQPLIDAFSKIADKVFVVGKIAADGYTPAPSIANKVWVAPSFVEDNDGNKLDIDHPAVLELAPQLEDLKTVIWNGLAGRAEDPFYAYGSTMIANFIGTLTTMRHATSIICGGDTVGFVEQHQKEFNPPSALNYTLLSTGGGASLELLCGNELPGLTALDDK